MIKLTKLTTPTYIEFPMSCDLLLFLLCSMGRKKSQTTKRTASEPNLADKTVSPAKRGHPSIQETDEEVTFNFTAAKLRELLEDASEKAVVKALARAKQPQPSTSTFGLGTSQLSDNGSPDANEGSDALAKVIMEGDESGKPVLHVTSGLPLDLHVSPKLREKVLSGKFVELGELLEKDPERLEMLDISFSRNKVVAKSKSDVVRTFDQYDLAWDIFMTIYARKEENKSELPALVKHRANVKDIHDRQGRWLFYDSQFRRLKELLGSDLQWDCLHGEIYMKAMSPISRMERRTEIREAVPTGGNRWGKGQGANVLQTPGYCWNFLSGKPCNCQGKFKHVCPKCSQVHDSGIYTPGSCFRGKAKSFQGTTGGQNVSTPTGAPTGAPAPRQANAKQPASPRK